MVVRPLQLDSLLKQDGFGLPLPGKWWWTIKIGHPRDRPRLRSIFAKTALLCESVRVTDPRYLPLAEVDADVRWLVEESSVQMEGYPDVSATDGARVRRAMITQPFVWGGEDETFTLLDEALSTAFDIPHIQDHVAKLRRTQADERHLFLVVDMYDLPFSLFGALGFADALPAGVPALPQGLTHLWLAPVYGYRVLIGTSAGWTETRDIRPSLGVTVVERLFDIEACQPKDKPSPLSSTAKPSSSRDGQNCSRSSIICATWLRDAITYEPNALASLLARGLLTLASEARN
jgi:hypothetical protein